MKRIIAILGAVMLLALAAFGCGSKEPAMVQLPDDGTNTTAWQPPELSETETEPAEPTDPEPTTQAGVITSIVYLSPTTTKAPGSTAKPSPGSSKTNPPATTTKKPTSSTKYFANGITINSKESALSYFNAAVKKTLDKKAGFSKSHKVVYKDWTFDQDLLDSFTLPGLGSYVDPSTYLSGALNNALGKGVTTATAHQGDSHSLMKNSTLTMANLKDIVYSGSTGGNWTITLTVVNGDTRKTKSGGASGSAPIDKGPLHMATGDGGIYDHMSGEQIFDIIKKQLTIINADPIDISESTTQTKFIATLDGEGKLIGLTASYNQTINLNQIKILNGASTYEDNTGSATVTITYDTFVY